MLASANFLVADFGLSKTRACRFGHLSDACPVTHSVRKAVTVQPTKTAPEHRANVLLMNIGKHASPTVQSTQLGILNWEHAWLVMQSV
jgi:hypothetical protein